MKNVSIFFFYSPVPFCNDGICPAPCVPTKTEEEKTPADEISEAMNELQDELKKAGKDAEQQCCQML